MRATFCFHAISLKSGFGEGRGILIDAQFTLLDNGNRCLRFFGHRNDKNGITAPDTVERIAHSPLLRL